MWRFLTLGLRRKGWVDLQQLIKFAFWFQRCFSEGLGGFEAFNQVSLLGSTVFFLSMDFWIHFPCFIESLSCLHPSELPWRAAAQWGLNSMAQPPKYQHFWSFQPLPSGTLGKFLDGAAGRTNLGQHLKFCLVSGSDCRLTSELLLGIPAGYRS